MTLNYKLHIFISPQKSDKKPEIKTFEFEIEPLSQHDKKANTASKYSINKSLSLLNGESVDIEVGLLKFKNEQQQHISLHVLSQGDMLLGVQAEIGTIVFWRSQLGSDVEFIIIPNEQLSHSSLGDSGH